MNRDLSSITGPKVPTAPYPAHLLGVSMALLVFSVLASTSRFFRLDGPILLPSGTYGIVPALILAALSIAGNGWKLPRPSLEGFSAGLIFLWISDWFDRSYNFLPDPITRGDILTLGALFLLVPLACRERVLKLTAAGAITVLAALFVAEAKGRLLFSDDHASFLFRLALLDAKFPDIPFFYPFWNAGLDARDFFATGALSAYILAFPLLSVFSAFEVYNALITFLVFGLLPLSLYAAARIQGLRGSAPLLAGLIGVCGSLLWYRWALKFGTVGFLVSASLAPLVVSLGSRFLDPSFRPGWAYRAAFIGVTTLLLLWPAAGLTLIPLAIIGGLVILRRLWTRAFPLVAPGAWLTLAVLLAVNLPWMTVFWSVSKVGGFLQREETAVHGGSLQPEGTQVLAENVHRGFRHRTSASVSQAVTSGLKTAREKALSANPLLLFLSLPGLFLISRGSRPVITGTAMWLLFLGTVGVTLKPQLELDRMLLILGLFLAPATAAATQKLLTTDNSWLRSPLVIFTSGLLLLSPFTTAAILQNRTLEQFAFATPLVTNLSSALAEFGGSGRTVFSGSIVHELDEGHVAPLTLMSGKPLVASAPFHTLWRYTQVVPKSFMERGDHGIVDFLDFMNATSVVAHERTWRQYFEARPDQYRLVWRQGRFTLWERLWSPKSYFAAGSGELLAQSIDSITARIDSSGAILKFNYFPFLESSGCILGASRVAPDLELVHVRDCPPGITVTIKAKGVIRRVFG